MPLGAEGKWKMAHYLTRTDDRLQKVKTGALVQEIVTRVRADIAWASILGDDATSADEAISLLRNAVREIRALKAHSHEWSEESYCMVCGADGRA